MENLIQYSSSVVFYVVSFSLSALFAGLAQIYCRYSSKQNSPGSLMQTTRPNRFWLFLSFIVLVLLASFRYETGTDFTTYESLYHDLNEIDTFEKFFKQLPVTEPGFILLNLMTKAIFNNSQMIFALSAFLMLVFFYFAMSRYAEKNSIMLAVVIFVGFFFAQSLNIMRQIIAIAIVFYATQYLFQKKYRLAVLWLLIATSFHVSALVVLPFWLLYGDSTWKKRARVILFILFFIVVMGVLQFPSSFSRIPVINLLLRNATPGASFGIGLILLRAPIILPILFFRKRLVQHDARNKYWLVLLFFELLFSYLGYANEVFNRMALYFSVSWIVLLPSLVRCMPTKNTQRFMGGYVVLLVVVLWGYNTIFKNYGETLPYKSIFALPFL